MLIQFGGICVAFLAIATTAVVGDSIPLNSTAAELGVSDDCWTTIKTLYASPCIKLQLRSSSASNQTPFNESCPILLDDSRCGKEVIHAAYKQIDANCTKESDKSNYNVQKAYGTWARVTILQQLCTRDEQGNFCQWKGTLAHLDGQCAKCHIETFKSFTTKWSPPTTTAVPLEDTFRELRSNMTKYIRKCQANDSASTPDGEPGEESAATRPHRSIMLFEYITLIVALAGLSYVL
ncbi:hypothetical protein SYNPS1DRAFT_26455 [Syncephalis pseudoplumigaleata]|uniref:Secreted protein n=1 Tax=Syncephalis pseudoplumigaleata TaxID=1712513 RepID=A0A4P9Z5R5_9FUNG|nr:hypothetical protein SYNPS1DRAFT_26455 [Syncephalis pseudoplumigaleata]|eukprot:RKP27926.1 hypothetical protein SYNPS1DRAFT_26455 [Syncephalis pseudoplumigaleata]